MDKVYILGDIHGDWKPIRELHLRHNTNKEYNEANKTLILLGDVGANFFFNYRDDEFKKKLGKYPFTYFCIRGNHEERPSLCMEKFPDKWHIETYFDNQVYVENDYPYIKYALDEPAIYYINGYRTFILPGAYSCDKYKRLQMGWSWFPQEMLSQEEMNWGIILAESTNWKVDLVLSHTCPICYEPTDLFLSIVDQSMVDKTMERYLGQIEFKLDYHVWCFGHFHKWREYPRLSDDRRRLMLFNDYAVELDNLMNDEVINKV